MEDSKKMVRYDNQNLLVILMLISKQDRGDVINSDIESKK